MSENTRKIVDLIKEINKIQDIYWYNHTLFTWQWWLGIFLTIVPWIVWIVIRNKKSTNRLLFIGFFVILFTSHLDFLGVKMALWYYEYNVLPTLPAYIPWDSSLFPVTIMLLLQYKPNFNPYIKAVFFGAFTAFIGEPLFVAIKLYSPIVWRHTYSFPIYVIYVILYLICHYLSKRKNFESL